MRRIVTTFLVVAATAFAAAGCGGSGGGSSSSAADLVPPDALAFISVDTDFGSTQLKNAQAILDKFPIKAKLLASLRKAAASGGADLDALKSSVGPQLDVAVIRANGTTGVVGFTKPSDETAFDKQLDAGSKPALHTKISGWTVFSTNKTALDAVSHGSGNLSGVQAFKDAFASLPGSGGAIARAYVAPGAISQATSALGSTGGLPTGSLGFGQAKWVAAAATSHDDGVGLEVHLQEIGGSASSSASPLTAQIPSGSLLALSFGEAGSLLSKVGAASPTVLTTIQKALGVSLSDIAQALSGQTILYVRAGLPLPEVTIAALPSDPKAAEATVGKLIAKFAGGAKPEAQTIGGFPFHHFALGPVDLYNGVFNQELVVTDSPNAVSELQSKDNKLDSDPTFAAVKSAAGMPDSNQGFLYVNLKDGVPVAVALAKLFNQKIPPALSANLTPLRSFLLYGSHDGSAETLAAFLQTS